MAKIIKMEEVVIDRDGEIDTLTVAYHEDLCGCKRNTAEYLAPYRKVVSERYDNGEYDL